MTTRVEKSVLVNVPVSTAYNQWTQFEEFPRFMSGVKSVTQLQDDQLEWVAEIMGIRRQWKARILEQVPDHKVSWTAIEGATNAGAVTFDDVGGGQSSVHLSLEYEPKGLLEGLADKLHMVEKQAEGDLERFKAFIESESYATGAWRGSVNEGAQVGTPGVEDAAASRDDSGRAGVSGVAAAAAGAAVLAGGVAAAAGVKASKTASEDEAAPVAEPEGYSASAGQMDTELPYIEQMATPTPSEPVTPAPWPDSDAESELQTPRRADGAGQDTTPHPLA